MKHIYTFMVTCTSKLAYKAVGTKKDTIDWEIYYKKYENDFNKNVKVK